MTARVTEPHGTRWTVLVIGSAALAWTGFFVHNVADLPGQTLLSPESLYPSLVTVVLVILCIAPKTRLPGTWLLLAWTTLNLVGGALSVLPLPVLPFVPEQSAKHYGFHVGYAVTQLPLVWLCLSSVWARSRRGGEVSVRKPPVGSDPSPSIAGGPPTQGGPER